MKPHFASLAARLFQRLPAPAAAALALVFSIATLGAQVTHERLLNAQSEPQNWLLYNGSYSSHHYSKLDQITPENAKDLEMKWVFQARSLEKFEAIPLVVDGVMYLTEAPNNIVALDAATGREFWEHTYELPPQTTECCGKINRGVAVLGDTLFMGTLDAHLIAVDRFTGSRKWDVKVADYRTGYAIAVAPLAIKDKVIIGMAGGEKGIQGFLAAFDAETGKQVWRFNTIPQPGEKGHETWETDAWKTGGASIWVTGSYDPELNLTYWGVGNPGPDWNGDMRPGDNLYSDSIVALDADTGELKWHFQFTPHDEWDFDSVEVPVLIDAEWMGQRRKVILFANRNGFFYMLDRETGQFLRGAPFVKVTWATGLDDSGRPVLTPGAAPTPQGAIAFPGVQGGTNWYSPSYSPLTGLFYVTSWDDYYSVYFKWEQEYEPGAGFTAGSTRSPISPTRRRRFINWPRDAGYGAIRALEPATGKKVWEFRMADVSDSGLLTTASNLLVSGNREGHFLVLDARTGKLLTRRYLGGQVASSPVTYMVDGKQYISLASGSALFTFTLRD